jgi:hypothetical protein
MIYAPDMMKSKALRLAGGTKKLGELLRQFNGGRPISKQAIQQWGVCIPELREFQLRKIRPEWF